MKKILAVFLMLFAVSAKAEFTDAEKAEVLQQVIAIRDAGSSLYHIIGEYEVVDAATRAYEAHLNGLLYLLDLEGSSSGSPTIGSMTREQARSEGISRIGGSYASYALAIAKLQALPQTANVVEAIRVLKLSESRRTAFNGSLAYLEPRIAENLAMQGATRDKSANAGPHGDYRRYGEMINTFARRSMLWIRLASQIGSQNTSFRDTVLFGAGRVNGSIHKVGRFIPIALGLVVGVEHPEVSDDIDILFAGGTTQRGRHFFRMLMAFELFLGYDHRTPYDKDVFGRTVFIGLPYELGRSCKIIGNFMLADATIPQYARMAIDSMGWICESWGPLDSVGLNTLVLRFFTNVGPPGQTVGVCGANTVLQPGPPPTCVGTN